nr:MAG TPA: hypothetical protein [Caudoviricetes sp.]
MTERVPRGALHLIRQTAQKINKNFGLTNAASCGIIEP